eukprot:Anaeramoba_ignava/a90141_120.p8 GENE.a90141_120~~a90141_120.p8  ORF type:complete len:233 (-),score=11.31 a90141_120:858-1556(-)
MKNIAPKVFTGLAILIFIMAIGIMITGTLAIRRNEPVFILGYALAVVPTESMVGDNPDSLDINDLVIIKQIDVNEVDVADNPVIVYQGVYDNTDILIIHRVIGESTEGLITQGDNFETNPTSDQENGDQAYITSENFQGIYVAKITFLKPIANLMTNSRSTIFMIIVFILAIILITEIGHILKTINEKKKTQMAANHEAYLELMKANKRASMRDEIKKEYMANLGQSRDAKL